MTEDDLPLLGEALPVELVNTRYGQGGDFIDFLGEPALAALWLSATGADADGVDLGALRALRDAAHGIFSASVAGQPPQPRDIAVLNAAAAGGRSHPELAWAPSPRQVWVRVGTPTEALLAQLSAETIAFLVSADRAALRVCAGEGCTMFYVRDHHRRRFCHPSCSHRARQAAYYRRRQAQP